MNGNRCVCSAVSSRDERLNTSSPLAPHLTLPCRVAYNEMPFGFTQRRERQVRDTQVEPFVPSHLPISNVQWEPLIPFIGRANRALAHYEGVLYGVPNAELLLSPLTTQEAVLSSRIEGTQATLGDVFRFEAGEEPAGVEKQLDIQEILNYRRALREA